MGILDKLRKGFNELEKGLRWMWGESYAGSVGRRT